MSEWHEVRIGDISILRKGISYQSKDYTDKYSGHPFITIKCFVKGGGYEPSGIKFYSGFYTESDCLKKNDILFAVTDLTRAGDIVGSPLKVPDFGEGKMAIASMDCMKISPNSDRCDQEFLYHRLMLSDIRRQMVAYSAGSTVLHLDSKKVPLMRIQLPVKIKEQRAIASVLCTIDQVIEKTEDLIHKYQQIKAGLMHDLFTRGLTADGKLRPPREQAPELYQETPIGWIPKEWTLDTIGNLFQIQLGKMLSKAAKTGRWSAHYLGNKNVQWDKVDLTDLEEMDFNTTEREKFKLKAGDLLVCEGGDVGRTAMWRGEIEECYYQKAIHRLRPIDEWIKPSLMLRFMRYAKEIGIFTDFTSQSSIAHLTQEKLGRVNVFVPPLEEQSLMVNKFDCIDEKIYQEVEYLEKLQKQKSGLMHDLLSGKVPVKNDQAEPAHV